MNRAIVGIAAALAAAVGGLMLLPAPLKSQPNTATISPAVTSFTLSTASQQVIATNGTRRYIEFCNPSAVVIWLMPSPTAAAANTGIGLPAASTGTTVCFRSPNGANAGNSWNGLAASATPALTVLEWL